ncbi:16S rRNA (guanine(966)-N(2))-methyltransferase RsmD [Buchnera aphidicola]|uniref:16S rRNA (guanine(966)-N(2))-methyltransferase RsmD n=1 Tax=Buchnera aphidicola TaxID=9 RepID=UPI0031B86709
MKKNFIRINSGIFKNRKITFKKKNKIRPTTSFNRITLFNWLKPYIKNSLCLDCFSGTGSLGVESISNLAKFVTILEKKKKIIKIIKKNIKKLQIKNIKIIKTNAIQWLNKKGIPYDIIFLDPPYYNSILQKTIFMIEKNNWIKFNSIIYIEKAKNHKNLIIPKNWLLYKKKKLKKIIFYLYFCK